MDLYVVGRAVGKTHFTLETMYQERGWILVVATEAQASDHVRRLAERCVEEAPPPWFIGEVTPGTPAGFWKRFWEKRIVTPYGFYRVRGLVPDAKVAIDDLDHVLQGMFGDVQMATATGIRPHHEIPKGES